MVGPHDHFAMVLNFPLDYTRPITQHLLNAIYFLLPALVSSWYSIFFALRGFSSAHNFVTVTLSSSSMKKWWKASCVVEKHLTDENFPEVLEKAFIRRKHKDKLRNS